jgi:hypothetical protein
MFGISIALADVAYGFIMNSSVLILSKVLKNRNLRPYDPPRMR